MSGFGFVLVDLNAREERAGQARAAKRVEWVGMKGPPCLRGGIVPKGLGAVNYKMIIFGEYSA